MDQSRLRPLYQRSWAICVGIDDYINSPQLSCAVNDAEAVSTALQQNLGFASDDVVVLKNTDATKLNILAEIERITNNLNVSADDRIVFFFAGHGHTVPSIRGEKGYLVPVEGSANSVSSMVSWDAIVELFEHSFAKHVFFVLDACYSGLAIRPATRSISQRYLQDLLTRPARQVIASGMKDQVVSDEGGSRSGHSIFTSFFLDILDRSELAGEPIVSATQAMSFLKNKVGGLASSEQTPHYGSLYGDGDLLIHFPSVEVNVDEPKYHVVEYDADILRDPASLSERVKDIKTALADPSLVISLHEALVREVRGFQARVLKEFAAAPERDWMNNIPSLIGGFEEVATELASVMSVLGYWAKKDHVQSIQKLFSELFSPEYLPSGGNSILVALAHYPAVIVTKAFSDGCVAGRNREVFADIMTHMIPFGFAKQPYPVVKAYAKSVLEVNQAEVLKRLEAHVQNRFPTMERIHLYLQPILDETIYLSSEYESTSLEAEVLLFLGSVISPSTAPPNDWGPPGRFLYKTHSHSFNESILKDLKEEFEVQKSDWWPIKFDYFPNDLERVKAAFEMAFEAARQRGW